MTDLKDGEVYEMKGSGKKPYALKNTGGVYSCSCPAWRNQSLPIERRTCKHLRKLRGDDVEATRIGGDKPAELPEVPVAKTEAVPPPILLAHTWDETVDPCGWWMSEKLDGVRAYWDGANFISRLGNTYYAPDWFKKGLPTTALDGELWLGRKKFQQTISIVRRQDYNDAWREITYLVFDAPAMTVPFEQRIEWLYANIKRSESMPHAMPAEQVECKNLAHMQSFLSKIEKAGGEGLMLRQPGSMYEEGRSRTLLKVKSFKDDEALVVGHEPGKGKHKGRLGKLVVRWTNPAGKEVDFGVGTGFSDKEREDPPTIGSKITFKYQELTDGGVPRFPSYIGVRLD